MSDCQAVRAGVLMRDLGQLERDPILAAHLTTCARCSADVAHGAPGDRRHGRAC